MRYYYIQQKRPGDKWRNVKRIPGSREEAEAQAKVMHAQNTENQQYRVIQGPWTHDRIGKGKDAASGSEDS